MFVYFSFKEEVFRKGDLFRKISNTPKNYTIQYRYSKKDVGGGISYIQFNILGAEVDSSNRIIDNVGKCSD